jgi:hypothetical protein
LGSSLNLDYHEEIDLPDHSNTYALVQGDVTRRFLKARGYTIVAFETGYRWSQWEDADVYIEYGPHPSILNAFEYTFLQTTVMRFPLPYLLRAGIFAHPDTLHYRRTRYVLDQLMDVPRLVDSPKFVFAHLIIPHWPENFSPTGEQVASPTNDAEKIVGYRNAVTFINSEMLRLFDRIMADAATPPVIVIQGDHGPFMFTQPAQHLRILNAYYLPGTDHAPLYPSISPVNTFRVIFNTYFGQHYPLLEDASWFSPPEDKWNFEPVPTGCGN